MNKKLAKAILNEVKNGGFLTGDLPENKHELTTLAQEWVEAAQAEFEKGMKNDTVLAIIHLAEQLEQGTNTAVADKEGEEPGPALAVAETHLSTLDKIVSRENLPVPKELDDAPEPMPVDLTEVADKKIRFLASAFNAYLNRARWKHAIATSDLANAQHLRDHEYRKAYKRVYTEMIDSGTRPTKEAVDSFVQEDPTVIEWNKEVSNHQNNVAAFKALIDIYSSNVDRLSRESTIRHNEWERHR